jgi:hypothetical protein
MKYKRIPYSSYIANIWLKNLKCCIFCVFVIQCLLTANKIYLSGKCRYLLFNAYILQHFSVLTEPSSARLQFQGKWSIQELYLNIYLSVLCVSYIIIYHIKCKLLRYSYTDTHTHTYIHSYTHTHTHRHTHYIHIYTHTHTHTYIHTHTHTHTHTIDPPFHNMAFGYETGHNTIKSQLCKTTTNHISETNRQNAQLIKYNVYNSFLIEQSSTYILCW